VVQTRLLESGFRPVIIVACGFVDQFWLHRQISR